VAESATLPWVVFIMASSLVLLAFVVLSGRQSRLDARLRELSHGESPTPPSMPGLDPVSDFARAALPRMGAPLVPKSEEERTRLQSRLLQAGYYEPQAMAIFLGVKVLLMIGPALVGLGLSTLGWFHPQKAIILGTLIGAFGMILPSFWLDRCKAVRQATFRRSLPDALDILVICLEGGSSLPSALRRVASELRTAHPELAFELNIVQREVQLGAPVGEALRRFAERADLEELRSLSSVILQAEKFGASLVKALRVHAETLRGKRIQYAEEMAQKAVIKLLFPTVFFIMPAMFIVVLGPTTMQLVETLRSVR